MNSDENQRIRGEQPRSQQTAQAGAVYTDGRPACEAEQDAARAHANGAVNSGRPSHKKRWITLAAVLAIVAVGVGVYFGTANLRAYHRATSQMQERDYRAAIETLQQIPDYRDAQALIDECNYHLGAQAYADEAFTDAIAYFERAGSYQDAAEQRKRSIYAQGCALFDDGAYDEAQRYFDQLGREITQYGAVHFATLQAAKPYIMERALDLEPTIELYIGDLPSVMQSHDAARALGNLAQSERADVDADTGEKHVTITPAYYPGIKLAKAWRTGDASALTAQEKTAYERAQRLVQQARAETSGELELELWLHDWICQNVAYDNSAQAPASGKLELARHWTCVGAMLDGRANCQGFADTFYLLGTMAGFDVRYQFGKADDELHVWNAIELSGQWYYVDVTYDNFSDTFADRAGTYRFFNFAQDQVGTHKCRTHAEVADVAGTTGRQYDYYRAKDAVVSSLSQAASYSIRQRRGGTRLVHVRLDGTTADSAELSGAIKTLAQQQNVAASWTVYHWKGANSTSFTVYWKSFS